MSISKEELSENLMEPETTEDKRPARSQSHSNTIQDTGGDHDEMAFLSPGFDVSLSDSRILGEHIDITLMSCILPCLPLAMMKSSMENRQCSLVDFCLPPGTYQLRQQFRYKYLRTDARAPKPAQVDEDMAFKDCFVSLCCCLTPLAITQMAIEMGSREGYNPSRYASFQT